jgi:peptidoglycan hydrolase-like protein with peptidoglycan-binding domain
VPKLKGLGLLTLAYLKRPRVLASAALVGVGAWIFVNALFLQPEPHPAPFFFTRAHEQAKPGQPDELVRAVQDALRQLGYYAGPLDGLAGAQTQSAIEAFREQSGSDGSDEVSLELLSEIRSSRRPDLSPVATRVEPPSEGPPQAAPDNAEPSAASGQESPQPDGTVAAVQEALERSAYGPLTVDGIAGDATREAIMRFQKDHNLPVTGEVSDALVVELRAAGALGGG